MCSKLTSRLLLIFAGLLLVAAIGTTLSKPMAPRRDLGYERIIADLPTAHSGWEVTEQEVASTPEMKSAVTQMLNYDQAILREFRRGDLQVLLYVAYWKAGKFPARLVAQHTPEVCWPGYGWTQLDAHYDQKFVLPDGSAALPVQEVVFEKNRQYYHVWYWHIVNGRLSGFASGPNSKSLSIFDSFWTDVRAASGEQLFIRISSNAPWWRVGQEALVRELLTRLEPSLKGSG